MKDKASYKYYKTEYIEKLRVRVLVAKIILFLVLLLAVIWSGFLDQFVPYLICLLLVIPVYLIYLLTNRYFRRSIFKIFIKPAFENIFEQVSYISKGISRKMIKQTGMLKFRSSCRFSSNDHIQGYYRNVKFERADICIKRTIHNERYRKIIYYFKGRWLILEFPKEFPIQLQVVRKGFNFNEEEYAFSGTSFANILYEYKEETRRPIHIGDERFSNLFDIYGENSKEALGILTPELRGLLCQFAASIDGNVIFGFIKNRLHIAIYNNIDSMEADTGNEFDCDKMEKKVQYEINLITSFIDGLPPQLVQAVP